MAGCRCRAPPACRPGTRRSAGPRPARQSKVSHGRLLCEIGNANIGAHRTLPPSCFCSYWELLAVHVHRACPGGAQDSPAGLWAASLGLWEVPPELFTELSQPPWNTAGWLEVVSGSFQRLRLSARFSPVKLCFRGADSFFAFSTGPTLAPLGRRRAAVLSPLPARSLVPPAALRPAAALSEPEFPGARQSAPRAPRPRSLLEPHYRAALREWGIFPVEAA